MVFTPSAERTIIRALPPLRPAAEKCWPASAIMRRSETPLVDAIAHLFPASKSSAISAQTPRVCGELQRIN
jgi:hypothetical protein